MIDEGKRREARAEATEWAKHVLANQAAMILDVETTGLGEEAHPVQIGVTTMQGKTLFEALIWPDMSIPGAVTAIHGIGDKDVELALSFLELYPALKELFRAKREVVVYNAQFDWSVLAQECERYELPALEGRSTCAMLEYAKFNGKWDHKYDHWQWKSLTAACMQMGIRIDGAHSAVGDCRMTLELIQRMAGTNLVR